MRGYSFFKNTVVKMEEKANNKRSIIEKYGYWGLFILVIIPLPGTGAWTGSLVAALFNMNIKKSFLAITTGVIGAAIIVSTITYGIVKFV